MLVDAFLGCALLGSSLSLFAHLSCCANSVLESKELALEGGKLWGKLTKAAMVAGRYSLVPAVMSPQ